MAKKVVLCDSNILIRVLRGDDTIKDTLYSIGSKNLAISVVTYAEVYLGIRKGEKRATIELLNKITKLYIDKEISLKFIELIHNYGKDIFVPDGLIAATAIVYNIPLFTLNRKDFDYLPGIQLYDSKR